MTQFGSIKCKETFPRGLGEKCFIGLIKDSERYSLSLSLSSQGKDVIFRTVKPFISGA
jgi:hypothetical protein